MPVSLRRVPHLLRQRAGGRRGAGTTLSRSSGPGVRITEGASPACAQPGAGPTRGAPDQAGSPRRGRAPRWPSSASDAEAEAESALLTAAVAADQGASRQAASHTLELRMRQFADHRWRLGGCPGSAGRRPPRQRPAARTPPRTVERLADTAAAGDRVQHLDALADCCPRPRRRRPRGRRRRPCIWEVTLAAWLHAQPAARGRSRHGSCWPAPLADEGA